MVAAIRENQVVRYTYVSDTLCAPRVSQDKQSSFVTGGRAAARVVRSDIHPTVNNFLSEVLNVETTRTSLGS